MNDEQIDLTKCEGWFEQIFLNCLFSLADLSIWLCPYILQLPFLATSYASLIFSA